MNAGTTAPPETIGFVGLGSMGAAMATNLLRAGYALRVYNRTAEKAAPLVRLGAQLVSSPGAVVEPDGIVITMVADDSALSRVTLAEDGILGSLGQGGVHVCMSTISPALARELAARHREHGSAYVGAPVFGRPEAAAARKLFICAAGEPGAVARVRPLFTVLGQGVFEFGADPAAAHVVKLGGNFLIAAAIEGLGEACALIEKNGIDRTRFVECMAGTLFACPVYQNYGGAIAIDRYEPPGFRLALGLKDANLITDAATESLVPMPLAGLLHARFVSAVARGRQDLDWAAIALAAVEEAGLERTQGHPRDVEARPAARPTAIAERQES